MTTEAKLKKFEEDLLLLEDQNTKLSKVSGWRVPGSVAGESQGQWSANPQGQWPANPQGQ